MPFNIGPGELILILIIALVVLGPGKLPEVASSLGRSLREFRKAATDVSDAARVDAPAAQPVAQAQTQAPAPNTLSGAAEPNTIASGSAAAAGTAAGDATAPKSDAG